MLTNTTNTEHQERLHARRGGTSSGESTCAQLLFALVSHPCHRKKTSGARSVRPIADRQKEKETIPANESNNNHKPHKPEQIPTQTTNICEEYSLLPISRRALSSETITKQKKKQTKKNKGKEKKL